MQLDVFGLNKRTSICYHFQIKWFFNNDAPEDNCRCIMAGDTYSFIIDSFEERNCGRYTIIAENNYGKASCSAECLFEGSAFMNEVAQSEQCNVVTEDVYSGLSNASTRTFSQAQTVRTESKSIETLPVTKRDLSVQSTIPQMKDMSSQMHSSVKDHGIQINPEQRDKSTSYVHTSSHEAYSSSAGTHLRIDSGRLDPAVGIVIRATPERHNSVDYSTTLIKDINARQHFEPVELIVNSGSSSNLHQATYLEEQQSFQHRPMNRFEPVNLVIHKPGLGRSGSLPPIKSRVNYKNSHHVVETADEHRHHHHHHQHANHSYAQESKMSHYRDLQQRHHHHQPVVFKPVELVLDAANIETSGKRVRECSVPCSGSSGSKRRVACTCSVYMNLPCASSSSASCCYCCCSSCYVYEPVVVCTDNESITSDFISDRLVEPVCQHARHHHHQHQSHQHHHQHHQHQSHSHHQQQHRASVSSIDERFINQHTNSFGSVEMNVDVRTPPCIDVPLRNVQTAQGETVKLECVVSGK